MREILFRGIIKNDNSLYKRGQWAVGDLVRLQDGNDGKPHIYGCGEVFAETLGQYTGLIDKNGTKIFEGDILFLNNKYPYEMIFSQKRSGFVAVNRKNGLIITDFLKSEVVGNIYENRELLEIVKEV